MQQCRKINHRNGKLSFSCSMRLGELLGLTWDCVDISPEAIEENRAYVYINKETQLFRF